MRKSILTALLGKNGNIMHLKNVLNHYIFVNKFLLVEVFAGSNGTYGTLFL